jgi:DNA-binding transcriptional ArsR family regulator
MNNDNRNNRSPFWTIFTLFSFGLGFLLYILLKQAREDKGGDIRKGEAIIPKRKKLPEKVNKEEKIEEEIKTIKLSDRQEKIVKLLLVKEKVYPSELQDLLSNVSARTIRRDMSDLEEKGLVEQKGATKSTYYKYIGS